MESHCSGVIKQASLSQQCHALLWEQQRAWNEIKKSAENLNPTFTFFIATLLAIQLLPTAKPQMQMVDQLFLLRTEFGTGYLMTARLGSKINSANYSTTLIVKRVEMAYSR